MLNGNKEVMVARTATLSGTEVKRLGKFGVIGIANTLLDFVIYNLLSSHAGLSLVGSNMISTTVAMIFSFVANKRIVFKKADGYVLRELVLFFVVTAFGLYVLQTGIIKLLTEVWFLPMHILLSFLHTFRIENHDEFFVKNGAKAFATIISLIWNYIMYKKVVFK